MKRHGNIWPLIVSMDNLREAHRLSRRGKGHYRAVRQFEHNTEGNLQSIQHALMQRMFTTSPYVVETRKEGGKLREIYKLPYSPDRIVQHALMLVISPIFTRSFIRDTYQSIKGRGTSDARRRVQLAMKKDAPKYALKFDIAKYYPSVNNDLMKQAVRRKIKCPDTLWLIDDILDSRQGLPLGNYVSQLFGNVYLNQLDWWIKQNLGVRHYYRYCDDIVLMCDDKRQLRSWRMQVFNKVADLKLTIKPNWTVIDVHANGIDFVGYRFYPHKTLLRSRIAQSFRRIAGRLRSGKTTSAHAIPRIVAFKGWMQHINAKKLWRTYIKKSSIKRSELLYKGNPIKGSL